jgi:uncharacterized membrane protein
MEQSAWFFALLISGLAAGMFLMDFFCYYPILPRLPDPAAIELHQRSVPLRRTIFRVAVGLSGIATIGLLASSTGVASRRLLLANLLCLAVLVVYTNWALVPLNREIAAWLPESPPAGWRPLFSRMMLVERLRCWLPTAAFALQVAAFFVSRGAGTLRP